MQTVQSHTRRACRGGVEQDHFSSGWRRVHNVRPGQLKATKHRANRRDRRSIRAALRTVLRHLGEHMATESVYRVVSGCVDRVLGWDKYLLDTREPHHELPEFVTVFVTDTGRMLVVENDRLGPELAAEVCTLVREYIQNGSRPGAV